MNITDTNNAGPKESENKLIAEAKEESNRSNILKMSIGSFQSVSDEEIIKAESLKKVNDT